MIGAAIIGKPPKGEIDHAMGEGQRWTLLVHPWGSHGRHIHRAPDAQLAGGQVDAHQQMHRAGDLSHRKDQPGRRVIDRRAGDPQQSDSPTTVQRGQGNGVPNGGMPLHPSRACVKGVEGIALGGDDDALTNDQGFGIDGMVQVRCPGSAEPCWIGLVWQVASAGVIVVIGRPVGALQSRK